MDISFKQIYMQNISPKLIGIDLFLITNEAPYNHVEVALVLGMPVQEVLSIMTKHSIPSITLVDFFTIVMHSSSYICRLIQRQWKYAQVDQYTPEILADIYEINIHKVQAAFDTLDKSSVSSQEVMDVFNNIYTSVFIVNNEVR